LNDNNSGFLATPTISGGVITSITINNGGSNYMSTPNVVISSGISSTAILNVILNVATSLILSLVGNFKLNERVINFSSKSIKFNKLCHKIEDLLYNSIDEITTENIRANIDEYDTINEQIEYPFVGYIKDKLIKKYSNNRSMPNALNCVASEIVITNV
jgi:hypothetical protein